MHDPDGWEWDGKQEREEPFRCPRRFCEQRPSYTPEYVDAQVGNKDLVRRGILWQPWKDGQKNTIRDCVNHHERERRERNSQYESAKRGENS